MERRTSDRWSDRCTPAVFAPEVQDRERFRAADDARIRAAALRTDLALGGRNLWSTAALGAPLCLNGVWLHRCTAHHIQNAMPCTSHLCRSLQGLLIPARPLRLVQHRLFLGRARRGQGSLQPTCGPQLAKGCARRNGHAYSCRAAHDLVDCHCCRDCRDRSAARKPLKCRGLGAGPRQPGPAAMLRPVQYVAAAPAGFRKRFSMKNSIMRSVLIPLWPRSGPTWRSKLFPARCSSLMSCIMFDGCTLLSAVP
jgi:hypothetical protein